MKRNKDENEPSKIEIEAKMKKIKAIFCGLEENAEHVFFAYYRFNGYRCELEATLEQRIKPETLVKVMLSSNEAWKEVTIYATKVIQDKETS